jgi:hypothetical protein
MLRGLVLVSVVSVSAASAEAPSKATSIPREGNTALLARSATLNIIEVSISTVGAKQGAKPFNTGYVPKSYVERIGITVGGTELFVPRSIFCEMFDVHNAEIRLKQKTGVLALEGGDASESYWVEIEFDATRVRRSTSGSSLLPKNKVGQETIFHEHPLR